MTAGPRRRRLDDVLRVRSASGQTAAEYMGALLVVSVVIAAIVTGPGPQIASHLSHLVDCIAGGGCPAKAAAPTTTTPTLPVTTTAAAAVPTPNPQPGPAPPQPAAVWPGQAANLPQGGDRPYVPPKSSRGQPKKVPAGGRGGAKGYEDADGNIWVWNPPGGRTAHGGPHWDVQHPDGSHTNVDPDGKITHGDDNFPNKSRGGSNDGGSNDGGSSDDHTAEIVGGTAAGIGLGGIIWWGAKALSPACGPFVIVCAVVL
jgi:hypothetical protein